MKEISWGRVKGVPLGRQRVEEVGPAWSVRVSPRPPPSPPPPPGSALMMAAASTTPHICKGERGEVIDMFLQFIGFYHRRRINTKVVAAGWGTYCT